MVQMVTRRDGVELVRGEVLDVVELGELAAGVGRDELLELGHGLAAEIGAVHQEEDALGAGVLDEPVGEGAGGEGLARAGGHLDERARMGGGEGLLRDSVIAFDLAVAHARPASGWATGMPGEAGAKRVGFGEPARERFRAVEGEDATGTRVRDRVRRGRKFRRRWTRRGTGNVPGAID